MCSKVTVVVRGVRGISPGEDKRRSWWEGFVEKESEQAREMLISIVS